MKVAVVEKRATHGGTCLAGRRFSSWPTDASSRTCRCAGRT
jgi:hypothetical protein